MRVAVLENIYALSIKENIIFDEFMKQMEI